MSLFLECCLVRLFLDCERLCEAIKLLQSARFGTESENHEFVQNSQTRNVPGGPEVHIIVRWF